VKRRLIERILHDVCTVTGVAEDEVWVYICDIPADNIAEYGRVLPSPGDEAAWLTTLPESLRTRLLALGDLWQPGQAAGRGLPGYGLIRRGMSAASIGAGVPAAALVGRPTGPGPVGPSVIASI